MSESRPTLSELGAQIPPGIQNLIMFLEETLIKGRIAPLEAKLTLLERKVDGYTSEIVEKAIDSAIRSAYNTISDEMCMMVKSEVEKGVREALKAYFMEMEGIKKEMEECVKEVKEIASSVSRMIDAKLEELEERLAKLEPRLEIDAERIGRAISEKLTPITDELIKQVSERMAPHARQLEVLGSKLITVSRQVDQLSESIRYMISAIGECISKLERAGILKLGRGEEGEADTGQLLDMSDLVGGTEEEGGGD